MTLKLTSIAEKQAYYCYDSRPWRMKDAPVLNVALEAAMREHGLDHQFRFVWGGVVLVREEPHSSAIRASSDVFTIARGSREACHVIDGIVVPKYPFARAMQARGFYYINALDQKISGFTREEFVPKEYVARVDYRYLDFGTLRWYLEERDTAEAMVETSTYEKNDAVPLVEWNCRMPLATTDGLYYEPGLEMINVLKQRVWENHNADLKAVGQEMRERREKSELEAEKQQERVEKKEFDEMYERVSKEVAKGTVYSIPFAPPKLAPPVDLKP